VKVLISFGQEKPDAALVELMLDKIKPYYFTRGAVFRYGYKWSKDGETPVSYDEQCWHIADPSDAPADHRGVEGCQAMLEGLYEGWMLGTKPARDKAKAAAEKRETRKRELREQHEMLEWRRKQGIEP
jgi:hypothetical protein